MEIKDKSDTEYWNKVEQRAKELHTDGCTRVTDTFIECCWEHDVAYRDGKTVEGIIVPNTKVADLAFRKCMQNRSRVGVLSPVSWIRWIGLRIINNIIKRHELPTRSVANITRDKLS